jgi:hypothetical protein
MILVKEGDCQHARSLMWPRKAELGGSSNVVKRRTWDDAVSGGGEACTVKRIITLPSSFWVGLERGRRDLLGTQR